MKLLVVNLQNPGETCYKSPKTIGSWLWGRRLSNYKLYCYDDGELYPIIPKSSDIMLIQEQVDTFFKK